tara:strand:- start:487 stop:654 length:168 start_codon:yes stop_codon:yes gene_type:complete
MDLKKIGSWYLGLLFVAGIIFDLFEGNNLLFGILWVVGSIIILYDFVKNPNKYKF